MGLFKVNPILKRKWEEHKIATRARHAEKKAYLEERVAKASEYGRERVKIEQARRLAKVKSGRTGLSSLNWGAAATHMGAMFDMGGPGGRPRSQTGGGMVYDPIQGWVSAGRSSVRHGRHRRKKTGKVIQIRV